MIVGKCLRCGDCCKEAYRFTYKRIDEKHVQLILEGEDPNAKPCPSLSFEPDGKATCLIHELKHDLCKNWPHCKEELIFPRCGYRWIEKEAEIENARS